MKTVGQFSVNVNIACCFTNGLADQTTVAVQPAAHYSSGFCGRV